MDGSRVSRLLLAIGVLLALAVGLYFLLSGQERRVTSTAAVVVPGPINGQVNYPHLKAQNFPQASASAEGRQATDQLCDGNCSCGLTADPCQSGRTCTPGRCDAPLDKKRWRLRLGGLKIKDEPPNGIDGDTTVCVSRSGKGGPYCASLRATKGDKCSGGGQGLETSTDELLAPGLDIVIRNGQGKVMAQGTGLAYKFMNERELCTGLRFGGPKFSGPTEIDRVWYYLDEL